MTEIDFKLPAIPTEPSTDPDRYRFPLPVDGIAEGSVLTQWLYEPTPEQIAMFARVSSRVASDGDKLYGAWEFVQAITDSNSFNYLRGRYLDPADPFDNEQLAELLNIVAEHFAQRNAANRAERRANKKKS